MAKVVTVYNLAECKAQEVFDFITASLFVLGPAEKLKLTDHSCVIARMLFGAWYKETYNGLSWYQLIQAGIVCNHFAALIRAITAEYNSSVLLSVEGEDFNKVLRIRLRSLAFRFNLEHKL